MIKNNKISSVLVMAILLLSSCGSTSSIITHDINSNATTITAKKETLNDTDLQKWPFADLIQDSLPGISLDKAYEFLKNKKNNPVIVGVIDSGVDIEHEGLSNQIWQNEDEIPNNKKDDDKNGFVDDVYGWNFLGSKDGNIRDAQLEITRMIKVYESKTIDEIIETDQEDYDLYYKQKKEFSTSSQALEANYRYLKKVSKELKLSDELKKNLISLEERYNYYYNLDIDPRKAIGDNPNDLSDLSYGNPDVIGFKDWEYHGTHVAGIVANIAKENPKNKIQIMPIRAVPGGDEYDKDIALAIRYAVDNGAKVINMSFGKNYSPHADWVYDAIEYAQKKDVLLIMGAGNDAQDTDTDLRYPNDNKGNTIEFTDNMITVGAITPYFNEKIISNFSNYGKKNVDVFAPGSTIYSALPNDKYDFKDGTSMAAPMVSGVAALVRSYYPNLTASQVKHIIMDSGLNIDFEVYVPGKKDEKQMFSELSVSGKILNAYSTLLMAKELSNKVRNDYP